MFGRWLPSDDSGTSSVAHATSKADLAFVTADGTKDWPNFRSEVGHVTNQHSELAGQRVGLLLEPTPQSLAQLFGLVEAQAHLFLIAADTGRETISEWASRFGLRAVLHCSGKFLHESQDGKPASPDAITILTSGTTGQPKAAEHTIQSLTRPVRQTKPGAIWLLTFRPHLYAGLQVILQCLLNQGTLVMPAPRSDAASVAELAASAGVEFVSATPSFYRWLLALGGDALRSIPLKQVTLGGEVADQATLTSIKEKFPDSRIVHIYATTELGRCFSVMDGMAGFPSELLNSVTPDGVELRITDEELVVRSANAMSGYDGAEKDTKLDWFPTGDLVSIQGNRVFFVGRKTDMINVGGNKVYPLEVESLVRTVPGVADTRVYGETSSLVGELVKCEIVVDSGFDAHEVERAVRAKALDELNNYQRPRFISIVDEIPRTDAGKTKRQ